MLATTERDSRSFHGLAYDEGGVRWRNTITLLVQDVLPRSAFPIDVLNLFCALGLKGSEGLDPEASFKKLLAWTKHVEARTAEWLPKYHRSPETFEHSIGKYRMLCLVTALQRDLGVKYYMPFSEGEYNASDSQNLFIHGILNGHGGTCVTLPVLYVAIGRRLGYPLFIVRSKEHFFVRWEEHGERFNVEATAQGFCPADDEHYRQNPRPLSDAELRSGYYLRNLTPDEEFGMFLNERATCNFDNLRLNDVIEDLRLGNVLTPEDRFMQHRMSVTRTLQWAIDDAVRCTASAGHSRIDLRTLPMAKPVYPFMEWANPLAREELNRVIRNTSNDCLYLRNPAQGV